MDKDWILPEDFCCGYFDCVTLGRSGRSAERTVNDYEIEIFLEDGLSIHVNNIEYRIKKDYVLVAKPGQKRWSNLPFVTLFLKFKAEGKIAEICSALPDYFRTDKPEMVKQLMWEMATCDEKTDKLRFYRSFFELVEVLKSDDSRSANCGDAAFGMVKLAKDYIEQNYFRKITLSDIAKEIHISSTHLHNNFTSVCGITPHKFLIITRVSAVKKMLSDNTKSLTDIAVLSGFGCQQYMTEIFKSETGVTPGRYRKKLAEKYTL